MVNPARQWAVNPSGNNNSAGSGGAIAGGLIGMLGAKSNTQYQLGMQQAMTDIDVDAHNRKKAFSTVADIKKENKKNKSIRKQRVREHGEKSAISEGVTTRDIDRASAAADKGVHLLETSAGTKFQATGPLLQSKFNEEVREKKKKEAADLAAKGAGQGNIPSEGPKKTDVDVTSNTPDVKGSGNPEAAKISNSHKKTNGATLSGDIKPDSTVIGDDPENMSAVYKTKGGSTVTSKMAPVSSFVEPSISEGTKSEEAATGKRKRLTDMSHEELVKHALTSKAKTPGSMGQLKTRDRDRDAAIEQRKRDMTNPSRTESNLSADNKDNDSTPDSVEDAAAATVEATVPPTKRGSGKSKPNTGAKKTDTGFELTEEPKS